MPSTAQLDDLRTRSRPLPTRGGSTVAVQQTTAQPRVRKAADPEKAAAKAKDGYIVDRLAAVCGYPASFCHGMVKNKWQNKEGAEKEVKVKSKLRLFCEEAHRGPHGPCRRARKEKH